MKTTKCIALGIATVYHAKRAGKFLNQIDKTFDKYSYDEYYEKWTVDNGNERMNRKLNKMMTKCDKAMKKAQIKLQNILCAA